MHNSAEEQISHGEEYHGFGDVEELLVIADEAAITGHPTDAALDVIAHGVGQAAKMALPSMAREIA